MLRKECKTGNGFSAEDAEKDGEDAEDSPFAADSAEA